MYQSRVQDSGINLDPDVEYQGSDINFGPDVE